MVPVAIYGDSKWSKLMADILEKEYAEFLEKNGQEPLGAAAFVVPEPGQTACAISVPEFARRYAAGELAAIIIPKEYYIQQGELVLTLLGLGVDPDDIYDGIRLDESVRRRPDALAHLITPMLYDPYLSYLEYHVADHCNLNCKYCTHYSPLVPEPVFTDFESFCRHLEQLKKWIPDIGIIRVLGGEPLLNPQLGDFIAYTRRLYPASILTVVTNGLLIPRMSEELMETMRNNTAFLHISYYPPMQERIGAAQAFLYEHQIPYTITALTREFNKTQTLTPQSDEDFFYRCFQASCVCMHDGKLAPCFAPFTTKYFNHAFGANLPTDEGINLYDPELTVPMLKASLLVPMNRCRYCIAGEAKEWEIAGRKSTIEDWV